MNNKHGSGAVWTVVVFLIGIIGLVFVMVVFVPKLLVGVELFKSIKEVFFPPAVPVFAQPSELQWMGCEGLTDYITRMGVPENRVMAYNEYCGRGSCGGLPSALIPAVIKSADRVCSQVVYQLSIKIPADISKEEADSIQLQNENNFRMVKSAYISLLNEQLTDTQRGAVEARRAELSYLLGQMYEKKQDIDSALMHYKDAADKYPNEYAQPSIDRLSEIYFNKAQEYYKNGDYKNALAYYQRVVDEGYLSKYTQPANEKIAQIKEEQMRQELEKQKQEQQAASEQSQSYSNALIYTEINEQYSSGKKLEDEFFAEELTPVQQYTGQFAAQKTKYNRFKLQEKARKAYTTARNRANLAIYSIPTQYAQSAKLSALRNQIEASGDNLLNCDDWFVPARWSSKEDEWDCENSWDNLDKSCCFIDKPFYQANQCEPCS